MKYLSQYKIIFLFFISATLLGYVFLRAYTLSFTHDESLSFTVVDGNTRWALTANNHKLNTLLMSWCKTFFGSSEISLRLPNVLSFLLYLMGCFLILKNSKKDWLLLVGFCLMIFNPFLLEFFSLARGYGLSLGLMLMSIYFLLETESPQSTASKYLKYSFLSILFAILALYANLALINYLIVVQIILVTKYLFVRTKDKDTAYFDFKFWGIIAAACIPLFLEIQTLLALNESGELYFGAKSFNEGLNSLITMSLSPSLDYDFVVLSIKIIVLLCLSLGLLLVISEKKFQSPLALLLMVMTLLLMGLFFEHWMFGAKFPMERTALFYIPLIAVFIYHLFSDLSTLNKIKKSYYIVVAFSFCSFALANFAMSANITNSKVWHYDAHTKAVMEKIKEMTQQEAKIKSISNHWLFEPTINYYIRTWKLKISSANRDGVNINSDFIYRLEETGAIANFKTICSYSDIHSELLMRIETPK